MKKNGKFLKIFTALLAAAVCFASGLITARLMPEKENNDAKEIQEQLAESITFTATVQVLEEISLDVDLSARGDVYQERMNILQNMYGSNQYRHEYFLVKLTEILPWTETGDLSEFIRDSNSPSEYIAVYLYGTPDEHHNVQYALQWGDTIVKLNGLRLENRYIELVKGRIEGASESSEMLVLWNYDSLAADVVVKDGKRITQYTLSGHGGTWARDVYSVAASENEVTVYTHNTALTVKVEGENEWDKKKFGCESSLMTQLTLYTYIAAYREDDNSPNPRKTHVAKLYGDIYLDTENDQFIVRDFYLTK